MITEAFSRDFPQRLQDFFKRSPVPVLALLALAGCLFSGQGGDGRKPVAVGTAEARLRLQPAPLAGSRPGLALLSAQAASLAGGIDSVVVRITADDIDPLRFSFAGDSLNVSLPGLPPGANRSLEAALFRAGRLLYLGKTVVDLKQEARLDVSVRCEPQFSRVYARFHLPLGFSAAVADGTLRLSNSAGQYSARLQIANEFGSFLIDELPGDVHYDLSLSLSDAKGKVVYRGDRTQLLLPLGQEAHWDLPLLPTQAEAGLGLNLGTPAGTDLTPSFPSRKRRPAGAGEAVMTEFYAAPAAKDSASEGEWFEVFNRSADTLALSGCRLARDRLGGVTRSLAFDSTHLLPPGRAMVFGRSAARADYHYQDFSLVNTSASLLLLCSGDSVVVDTLRYSSVAADSLTALPMRDGKVTSLDGDSLGSRGAAGAWCLTAMGDVGQGSTPGFASPGRLTSCAD